MISRIPSSPPVIKPVSAEEKRPLWSVMIPVYNCSKFIPEALQGVLDENMAEEDMEIEVVDDSSTDTDVEAMVTRIGKGRIKYYRQPQNVGSLRNFETCLNRSKGRLVHLLHGDDRINPGYYKKMEQLFQEHPEAGAAFCRVVYIDELGNPKAINCKLMEQDGVLEDWILRIAEANNIQYAAITVRREVYERLGAFYGSTYGEDWEMWVRMAKYYPVAYTPESFADYREHAASISGEKFANGESIQDIMKIMDTFKDHLPESERNKVLKRTKRQFAWYSCNTAASIWRRTHNKQITRNLIWKTLSIGGREILICWELGKLYIKTIINRS